MEAERLAHRVVDAAHLADRLRVLAHADVERDPVGPPRHAGSGVGDYHGRRLLRAMPEVAPNGLPGGESFDEAVRQRADGSFALLKRIGDQVDDSWLDQGVALGRVVQPLAHVHVITARTVLLLSGPLR